MKAPPPLGARPYEVVLWGATGFTGALVAEELVRRYGIAGELRWAIAGRSREKLEALRENLRRVDDAAKDLPMVVVKDARDPAAVAELVQSARVVATTVGPYALYGHELAAACAASGTSYCDLTGEPHFVRASIDRNHESAIATGARIVHACGFDAIPSDLGAFMLQEHAKSLGAPCPAIKMLVGSAKGGFSGGTVATMLQFAELGRDREFRRLIARPYGLDPEPDRTGSDGRDAFEVRYDKDAKRWTGPFIMAVMNTRVVRRTNALFGYAWGKDFRYSEAMSFHGGAKGFASAVAMTGAMGAFFGALSVEPLRELLKARVLPAPGEGPSPEDRARGHFTFRHFGSIAGEPFVGVVGDTFDPGYGSTARMFSEAAVCLAKDPLASPGGVLTPAFAMREHFLARARAIGMTFVVERAAPA